MRDQVSRLVGLEGFEVKGVVEDGDQLDLEVELIAPAGCCPRCERGSLDVKERPVVRVRDLPIAGRAVCLRWRKRRYGCRGCGRTFTESHPELPSRQRVTRRLRARLRERVAGGAAHAEVAREEAISRYQVARAFRESADDLAARRERRPTRRLSLDEAHHRRGAELATIASDLDRRAVIEVLEGRSRRVVGRWLASLPEWRRAAIEVVSIDPYEAYRQAIRAALPAARIVVDPFHLVRGAGEALEQVRRERQRGAARRPKGKGKRRSGKAASWRPELYRSRHRLLRARERLTERDRRRLCELFEREPALAEAWGLKEAFRAVYAAHDRAEAARRLDSFLAACDRAQIPSFGAFAKGVRLWREEILAYFEEPTTNGYAEGVINKVKVIKRRAYGLPTFEGFRERVLIACG
jgi:transposase